MDLDAFPRQLARTMFFTLGVPGSVSVSPDGERVLYLRTRGGEDTVSCLWQLNLADDGAERVLADPTELRPPGEQDDQIPEAERVRRERARETSSGIVGYSADTARQNVAFALDGRLWVASAGPSAGASAGASAGLPATGTNAAAEAPAIRMLPTAGPAVDPQIDPTGQRVAYVTGGALHVVEVADGCGRQLAEPENAEVTYGLAEHVAAESMLRYRGYWWAPDGQQILAARVDNSAVQLWWIADPANPQNPPRAVRYPSAGTTNADVSLHVIRLDGSRTEVRWDRTAFEYVPRVEWDDHGPLLSVQSRDQRTLHVLAADPATGTTTLLHTETDPAWVQLTYGAPLRTAAGRLVRVSDVGGSWRLVVDGEPVTPDGVQVREVLGADGETVHFVATQEPTEEHLWRYDPELGAVQLSHGPGLHRGTAAAATVVRLSRTDQGMTAAVTRPGRPDVTIPCLDAEPVVTPRITWLTVGERELRAALMLPSWYRTGTGLPVLMSPYGGPALQRVVRARTGFFCEEQWLAEQGFAVLVVDGRGTPGRGPAWDKTVFGDTLTVVLEDQIDALHEVAAQHPDLDLSRVGIRGWSFGGFLAAMAVIRRPDVFHAAISGAAPHDQRLYDTHWRERFLGLPQEHPDAYDRCSPITWVAELTRPLLLVHGMADDNVVVAHTIRMSAALVAAGRPHQLLPLSGSTHMPTDENTLSQLLRHELTFLQDALGVSGPRQADAAAH